MVERVTLTPSRQREPKSFILRILMLKFFNIKILPAIFCETRSAQGFAQTGEGGYPLTTTGKAGGLRLSAVSAETFICG